MFSARAALRSSRAFSTSAAANTKVAVLGAAGGIGQPLSLLLKQNPLVTKLSLFDIRGAPGVAADVAHVNSNAEITEKKELDFLWKMVLAVLPWCGIWLHRWGESDLCGPRTTVGSTVCVGFAPENNGLEAALEGAEIVIIPAGMPRKPGMTRDDLFNSNASIIRDLTAAVAKVAPKAFLGIIANPVNSTVPITAEVFKAAGVYDAKRLFGITTLDVVRASMMSAQSVGDSSLADTVSIPVVGGHAGTTIVPLLSQASPALPASLFDDKEKLAALVKRIMFGGDEVVQAKDGSGSATLSMAYAAAVFTDALLKAKRGDKDIVQCTFVDSPLFADKGVPFFSSKVTLGPNGVETIHPLGEITPYEQELVEASLGDLAKQIQKGVSFIKK
ncbi:malate dehydrogenase [Pseudohyphozyma bogoriensis]|nr:malate dehydrogenase [Pseudohyphozyma bogoriensis]